jgi:small-conductance mechanosensitive channel
MPVTTDSVIELIGLDFQSIAVLVLSALLGYLLAIAVAYLTRRFSGAEKAGLLDVIAARCANPLRLFFPILAVSVVLAGLDHSGGLAERLPRVFAILTILAAGWLAVGVVKGIVDYCVSAYRIDHADNLAARRMQTQIRVLGRVVVFIVYVATAAAVLMSIPSIRHIGVSIFASAGIAGLALGLAARPALSNLIAGIQIALTQPIRLEDAVVVEGEWGWIEEIHMTYVVVRVWDLRRLILPISYFIEKPFQNWTRTTADIIGSVMLYMDYSVSVDEIRAEFSRVLRESKFWDGKVEVVHVTDCTEKSMQIRLLMSAGNSPDAWELRCEVRERLLAYLQRHHPACLPRLRVATLTREPGNTVTNSP